ncbi:LysM peptidoglycan-binding domain-containing protein [Oligoflexia bacterium]|nr:LysM peptidoglycan-binding domain-containing protein [Oligoflexia bacterium]
MSLFGQIKGLWGGQPDASGSASGSGKDPSPERLALALLTALTLPACNDEQEQGPPRVEEPEESPVIHEQTEEELAQTVFGAEARKEFEALWQGKKPAGSEAASTTQDEGQSVDDPPQEKVKTYKIKAGDSLWKIARDVLGDVSRVDDIRKANEGVDLGTLQIGQLIKLPSAKSQTKTEEAKLPEAEKIVETDQGFSYLVSRGENLSGITTACYGMDPELFRQRILSANPGLKAKNLPSGKRIVVPYLPTHVKAKGGETLLYVAAVELRSAALWPEVMKLNPGLRMTSAPITLTKDQSIRVRPDRGTPASKPTPNLTAALQRHVETPTPTRALQRIPPPAKRFIEEHGNLAAACEKEFCLPAAAILSVAMHESGYGSSELASKAKNLFGIKADPSWRGEKFTIEGIGAFRKYGSVEESFRDFCQFLGDNPDRYARCCLQLDDPQGFLEAMASGGYDPGNGAWITGAKARLAYIAQKGEVDAVPPKDGCITYVVQSGETLSGIAKDRCGKSSLWRKLAEENPHINPDRIREGDQIYIPKALLKKR